MLFSGGFAEELPSFSKSDKSDRECRVVFIGRHVKQKHSETLREGILGCAAETQLRFEIGEEVEVKVDTERGLSSRFKRAKVMGVWQEGNAYKLELVSVGAENSNSIVWAPEDSDDFVRKRTAEGGGAFSRLKARKLAQDV